MAYTSRKGRRPVEYASKSSHSYIINDPTIQEFLSSCDYPKDVEEIDLSIANIYKVKDPSSNPIKNVIAIDGGQRPIPVRKEFPSSIITFFQFGALYFSINDLDNLYQKAFIEPKDMSKLKEIQRYKFVLPTKNVRTKKADNLLNSVRSSIYDLFMQKHAGGDKFMDSFKWLIYEEFESKIQEWNLASCPTCLERSIKLTKSSISADFTFLCPHCKNTIFLTDVFRFHEVVDNELGAGGIESYLGNVLEQAVLVHMIYIILNTKPQLLKEIIFIKDGQLAFFGQTANLSTPMKSLINYLFQKYNLYLAGLEKTGAFVDHADEIAKIIKPRTALILNNDYIYKYIIPGRGDITKAYGSSTYYGSKLIYKTDEDRIYVITIPTKEIKAHPQLSDLPNLDVILFNVRKLKSDMYDSALIPVTLANKLVSLSEHPSSVILEKFARNSARK